MSSLFKKISIGVLLLLVAGAVFFCTFAGESQTSHAMAGMPSGHPSMNHFLYIQQLTATNASTNLFVLVGFLVATISIALVVFISNDSPESNISFNYPRKKQRGIFGLAQGIAHHWLSRLENSPSFVLAA